MNSTKVAPLAFVCLLSSLTACEKSPAAPATTGKTETMAPAASAIAAAAPNPATPATPAVVTPAAAGTGEVSVGKPAPTFSAAAHNGTKVDLKSEIGKRPVVVYFYPKDETPGCTKEACAFRDAWTELGKTNVLLVGISGDSLESHKAFAEHHKLPFTLVSDADGAIAKSFGVPFTAGFAGRQSFVIGKDGNLKKIYRSVDVTAHAKEIQADLATP
jgi:thioredoxin-dependent peroxiredoxin